MGRHWLQPDWDPGVTVVQLPLQPLINQGISTLLLDVDRTLLPGHDVTLPAAVLTWATEARRHLNLHLFSNNPSRQRIGAVADQLQIDFTSGAGKPCRAALRRVLNQLNPNEAMRLLIDRLKKTQSNAEFLASFDPGN